MMHKPVEEVARVLVGHMDSYAANGPGRVFPHAPGTGQWPDDYARIEQAAVRLATHAVLNRLRELGFINDIGLESIKSEEEEAGKK